MTVCAEISYNGVHSDICPPAHEFANIDTEHRQFLHDCLDEWLDNSNGDGIFYIKDSSDTAAYKFQEDDFQ